MFSLMVSSIALFAPTVKLTSGRSVTLSGKGPPVVFSPGLFGVMPHQGYSKLLKRLHKKMTIITFNDVLPMMRNDIEDITNELNIQSVGFLSHSSFNPQILTSDFIEKAFLCDPVSLPRINFGGLENVNVETSCPIKVVQASKTQTPKTKEPIPEFNIPDFGDMTTIEQYDNIGHLDILDDFWADLFLKIGVWETSDKAKNSFRDWKFENSADKSHVKNERIKYRNYLADEIEDFMLKDNVPKLLT